MDTETNHKEETVAVLDPKVEIPDEALANVDLQVPPEYDGEIAIAQLDVLLTEYRKVSNLRIAASRVEDGKQVKALSDQMAYLKAAIAFLQFRFPGAKKQAEMLMVRRTKQAQENRIAEVA